MTDLQSEDLSLNPGVVGCGTVLLHGSLGW